MGYLNVGQCGVLELFPSVASCDGSTQGVQNWGYISKGYGLTGMTVNSSGTCSSLTFQSGKTFFTANPEAETCQIKITANTNKYKNTTYTAVFNGTIGGWDDQTRETFSVIQKTNGHIWVQLMSNEYLLIGVQNETNPALSQGAKLTKQEWDSGIDSESDYSGVAFEFTAKSSTKPRRILPTVMTSSVTV